MASPPFELEINGKSYVDFKTASVSYSMDALSRSFTFDFTDKWFRSLVQDMPFIEGDEVSVRLYGEVVCRGYIEDIPIDYDSASRRIGIAGRSRACDLVDCSAVYRTGTWRNATLADIGSALLQPYPVNLSVDPLAADAVVPPFPRYAIEDEETVFGCLSRAAKMRGVFLLGDAEGNVIISKAGKRVFPYSLIQGQNSKAASRTSNFRDRYSDYLIKSQTAGDDANFGDVVGKNFYSTTDPQVKRHRPLIIISDGQGKPPELKTRGDWERNTRAGKSRRLTYRHQGFRGNGQLFALNQLIAVKDPVLDFDGVLLVSGVTYSYGFPGGEVTSIELAAPETYDVLIPPKPRPRRSGGALW